METRTRLQDNGEDMMIMKVVRCWEKTRSRNGRMTIVRGQRM